MTNKSDNQLDNLKDITNNLTNSHISSVTTDKIGDKHIYKSSYKPNTKSLSKCYWCHSIISNDICPIGLPIRIKKEEKKDKFIVEGCFCSWNCILSYIDQQSSVKYRECKIYLNLLYKQLYTNSVTNFYDIKPSKDWRLLKIYGGTLSIDAWKQDNFIQIDKNNNDNIINKYKECVIQSEQILFD